MSTPSDPTWTGTSPSPYPPTEYPSTGYPSTETGSSGSDGGGTRTADVAKQEAASVAQSAAGAAQQVGGTAKEQASAVASDAKQQAQRLASQTRDQVNEQIISQRDRAASGLRSLGGDLRNMAQTGGESGIATQLAHQAADTTHQIADYLERHEPSEVLDDVRAFARRRPGAFLLGAAVAGVVAGRMTRGIKSATSSDGADTSSRPSTYPPASYPPALTSDPAYLAGGASTEPVGSTFGTGTTEYSTGYVEPTGYVDPIDSGRGADPGTVIR